MIVCHCNRITSQDIDDAVTCMKKNCSDPDLCPHNVYKELGACPNCCNCFPLADKLIKESVLRFISLSEIANGSQAK